MGRFNDELRKRGAYLYGSRALKVAGLSSDWDWALPYDVKHGDWLYKCGFRLEGGNGTYNGSLRRYKYHSYQPIAKPNKAITELPGFNGEVMKSYRKGNTNVVMFTPLAFAANRYATQMAGTYDPESYELKTKEARIQTYQRFAQEYLRIYHNR